VREQGWCLLNQELELGLMSVAAPVHDGPKVVAAINVSLQAQSVAGQADPEAYLESVRKAATATAELISGDLSGGR
jgi:IclR family pca regulon transcriptional regulator